MAISNTSSLGASGNAGLSENHHRKGALTTGAIAALTLHAVAAIAIFNVATTQPLPPAIPIMVSMITAPEPEPQEIPKPRPVTPKAVPTPKTLLVAEKPADQPAEAAPAPPPPPAAAPPTEAAPAAAVIPPRFDAAYLDNPSPPYPPMSRRMGEQGRVMLHVFVNADGSAGKVELRSSSGVPRLDQSALDTVKRWRFVPAKLGTQPVAAWVIVPILFSLGA